MPLVARPSIGLLTSASLRNCVVSSLAAALCVEIVRQVEPAGRERQPLPEELRPQPRFAQVQFVLVRPGGRCSRSAASATGSPVRRRAAQADDIRKEDRVLRDPAVKNRSADASA